MIDKLQTILLGSHVTWSIDRDYRDAEVYSGMVASVYVKDDEIWLSVVLSSSGRIREIESKYCTVKPLEIKYTYGESRPYMPSATLQAPTHPNSFPANFGR